MKIGMMFPGYGSQFITMGKELYDESRLMQEYFEEAGNCLDKNFVKLCFASSDADISDNLENAYTSLFLVSASLAAVLKEHGIKPDVVAGYNLGEYAAIHAGGGITLPDSLYLLSKYAACYQQLLDDNEFAGIKVTGVNYDVVEEWCLQASKDNERAYVAFANTSREFVVMGDAAAVKRIRAFVSDVLRNKIRLEDASLGAGLHSPLMDGVAANFKMYFEKVDFRALTCPLISAADARTMIEGDEVKTATIKQISSPVIWSDVMDAFIDCDLVIEVGPGNYLATLLRSVYPEKHCISFNKKADLDEIKKSIELQFEPEVNLEK